MLARRQFLSLAGAPALAATLASAQASDLGRYPDRAIRFIVAKPPGGLDDSVARILQAPMQKILGQSVVIENIGGAQGVIGTQTLIRAEPDGYRVMVMNTRQQFTAGAVMEKAPFDLSKDITPIAPFAFFRTAVLVHPSVPGADMMEVLQYAKMNPNKVLYGTTGVGSSSHLSMAMAARHIGAEMLAVPYKGGGPGAVALAAGEVHVFYTDLGTALSTARMGRGARIIAQSGSSRAKEAPDIPLFPEAVRSYFAPGSLSLIGPRGMDVGIAERIANAARQAVVQPDVADRLRKVGVEPSAGDAAALRSEIEELTTRWGPEAKVIQAIAEGKAGGAPQK